MYFVHQLKNSIMLLFVIFSSDMFLNVLTTKHINSLQFQGGFDVTANVRKNILEIFPLLNSSSPLCVTSKNQQVTDVFLKIFRTNINALILNDLKLELKECFTVVMLEMDNFINCTQILTTLYKSSFYFINVFTDINFENLKYCFANSLSPEVVILVANGSLFELTPVFHVPRHFDRSTTYRIMENRRRRESLDLRGIVVTVASMPYPPFLIFPDKSKPEEGDGIEFRLFKELSHKLNFTIKYDIYQVWGLLLVNGTWIGEGIMSTMQEGKADIAVANLWQTPSLYTIVDFGPSLIKNSLAFLVRRPEQIDFQWQVFMTIFQPMVWFSTLASFLLVVVVYHAVILWELRPYTQSWLSSILTIFGHFTMSSSHTLAPQGSSRFLLTAWSVVSLLLTTSLSTGIVSRLTLPLYTPRVDTHRQLVEGGFYWTVQTYKSYQTAEVKNFMFDFEDRWNREFEQRYIYMEEEEVEKALKTNKKITFVAQTYGDDFFVINTKGVGDQCEGLKNYRRTKQVVEATHVSFGVKKHSTLLQPLTAITLRFLEAGLPRQWRDQVIRRWPRYAVNQLLIELDVPTFREPQPLKLSKLQPILYLLLCGLGFAAVIFILEIYW